eukprot:COSAG05_NODE_731_length_7667_cov_140.831792_8_plen_67_part_00
MPVDQIDSVVEKRLVSKVQEQVRGPPRIPFQHKCTADHARVAWKMFIIFIVIMVMGFSSYTHPTEP